MPVYFIGSQTNPKYPIKIGYSDNPQKRLKQIQNMSPIKLEILNTFDGNEGDIHNYFSAIRLHGEWFEPTDDLVEFIKSPFHPEVCNTNANTHIIRAPITKLGKSVTDKLFGDLPNCQSCNKKIMVVSRDDSEEDIFEFNYKESVLYCPLCGGDLT